MEEMLKHVSTRRLSHRRRYGINPQARQHLVRRLFHRCRYGRNPQARQHQTAFPQASIWNKSSSTSAPDGFPTVIDMEEILKHISTRRLSHRRRYGINPQAHQHQTAFPQSSIWKKSSSTSAPDGFPTGVDME